MFTKSWLKSWMTDEVLEDWHEYWSSCSAFISKHTTIDVILHFWLSACKPNYKFNFLQSKKHMSLTHFFCCFFSIVEKQLLCLLQELTFATEFSMVDSRQSKKTSVHSELSCMSFNSHSLTCSHYTCHVKTSLAFCFLTHSVQNYFTRSQNSPPTPSYLTDLHFHTHFHHTASTHLMQIFCP